MQRIGVRTIGELTNKTVQQLLETRNCGLTTVGEITMRLQEHGLGLAR